MIKKFLSLILLTLLLIIPINVFGENNNRIVDKAGKLADIQIQELTTHLNELSNKYDFDIVVYLSNDTSFGDDIVSEGCEFYDNNGYGYGQDHRGILLIVNYQQGVFDVITTGDGVREKYDGYIVDCYDAIQNSLGNNAYEAIQIFEYWIDTRFINENDNVNNSNTTEPTRNNNVEKLVLPGIVSTVFTTIISFALKGQLKTEGKKRSASNYINKNSFKLTRSGDIFLYRTTSRRRINNRNNNNQNTFHNSGGSGFHVSHTSSSGISHGSGGGRHF